MPARRFTKEQTAVIAEALKTKCADEVLETIVWKLDPTMTKQQFKSWRQNNNCAYGVKKNKTGISLLFTAEQQQFIKDNIDVYPNMILTDKLNEKFGTSFTRQQIKTYKGNHHLYSKVFTGRFPKGHPNPHKGDKTFRIPNSDATKFKKGHVPANKAKVGDRVKDTYGYWKTKIAEPDIWEYDHIALWEKTYGKFEKNKGWMIIFLDGNKDNLAIDNLFLITQQENGALLNGNYRQGDKELTKAGIGLFRLQNALKKK